MKASSLNRGKQIAGQILLTQCGVAVIGALIGLLVSVEASYSALFGGLIATAANAYFAVKAFSFSGASQAKRMMTSFYQGEAGKFVITVLLFLLAYKFMPNINPIALILTYSAATFAHILAPLLFGAEPKQTS